MTEVERIIKEGILPESFFKPETICDFYVDENRKKIWAVELDMLILLDKICKKHGLKYFLTDGTLLGAIRHKGFIPWDDDIDVSMPRKDYEKLLLLKDEFVYPYFLQTNDTDPSCFYSFAKIRNSNTSGFSKAFMYQGFNDGLALDIFPLDMIDLQYGRDTYSEITSITQGLSAYMKLSNIQLTEEERISLKNKASTSPKEDYQKLQKLACKFNDRDSEYLSHWVSTFDKYEKKVWYAEDFSNSVDWEFAGFNFPIPIGYHRYLICYFGDYMQLPPMDKRVSQLHLNAIFDPDIPYEIKKKELNILV